MRPNIRVSIIRYQDADAHDDDDDEFKTEEVTLVTRDNATPTTPLPFDGARADVDGEDDDDPPTAA
jgi:hypothetical protein